MLQDILVGFISQSPWTLLTLIPLYFVGAVCSYRFLWGLFQPVVEAELTIATFASVLCATWIFFLQPFDFPGFHPDGVKLLNFIMAWVVTGMALVAGQLTMLVLGIFCWIVRTFRSN